MKVGIGDLVGWGVFMLVLGLALGPPPWWVAVLSLYLWLLGGWAGAWAGRVCYRKLRDRQRDQAKEAV